MHLGDTLRQERCCCRNHPFEVARIEAQARGDQNQKDLNIAQIFRMIVREQVGLLPPAFWKHEG